MYTIPVCSTNASEGQYKRMPRNLRTVGHLTNLTELNCISSYKLEHKESVQIQGCRLSLTSSECRKASSSHSIYSVKYAYQFSRLLSQPFVEQRNCSKRKGSLSSFSLSIIEEVSDLLQTRRDNMVITTKVTLSTS